jgi:nitrite reductase/ring-hydroxylating ferredoxin subunit
MAIVAPPSANVVNGPWIQAALRPMPDLPPSKIARSSKKTAATVAGRERVPAAAPRATLKMESDWIPFDSLRGLAARPDSGIATHDVDGTPVAFVRLCTSVYAFRNACPACSKRLDGARIESPCLICDACGFAFDVIQAGGRGERVGPSPERFPLACENGRVRVVIPVGAS